MDGLSDVPLLDPHHHSGIPSRLIGPARAVKQATYDNLILPSTGLERAGELPVLPPNITRSEFEVAIQELISILGSSDYVIINDKELDDGWYMEHPYTHDAFHLLAQDDLVSSALAIPGSVKDVQGIARWANKHVIPIYPISMGRNLGYGGASPRVRGSVVIDMGKRMNKILELNNESCFALLEPGVSFYALHEEIVKTGRKVWADVPDLGGGSVIGNTLDRGVGYTPYGDHFGMHCGLEVVLPSGEVMRTGMGAMENSNTWQLFQYGFGPYADGIFTQSNFGIVTKMGIWLMPDPGGHQSYLITFPREDQLSQIAEIVRPLRIKNILGNVPQLRHLIQEAAVVGPKKDFYAGEGPIPASEYENIKKILKYAGVWNFYGTVYGPKVIRDAMLSVIKEEFGKIEGMRFYLPEDLPETHYIRSREMICAGIPNISELEWLNWIPNGTHLFFSPICPVTGHDAKTIFDLCMDLTKSYGLDMFPIFCVGWREAHLIVTIIFDKYSNSSKKLAYQLIREMIDKAAKLGYGEYRTHLVLQDQVAGTYSWGNGALMKFNEQLKDALDPNGILAPGRGGIWPKSYRGKGWELTDTTRGSAPGLTGDI